MSFSEQDDFVASGSGLPDTLSRWTPSGVAMGGEAERNEETQRDDDIERLLNATKNLTETSDLSRPFAGLTTESGSEYVSGIEDQDFFQGLVTPTRLMKIEQKDVAKQGEFARTTEDVILSDIKLEDKRYKLFIVPPSQQEMNNYCFRLIGSGSTICIAANCRRKHQGGPCPVVPGEGYVLKDRTKAFMSPSVDLDLIDPELASGWKTSAKTLDEWKTLFNLASSSNSG